MARLIDADALWRKFESEPWYDNADRDEIAIPLVDDAPTVDAVEVVRHGRWIEMEYLSPDPYYTCSVCGEVIYMEETGDPASDLFTYTYCPHCGSKMDERSINGEDEC